MGFQIAEPFRIGRRCFFVTAETGMVGDRRKSGGWAFRSSGSGLYAACSGLIALNVASCACDVTGRTEPPVLSSTPDGPHLLPLQRRPVAQRSVAQQASSEEPHRNDA